MAFLVKGSERGGVTSAAGMASAVAANQREFPGVVGDHMGYASYAAQRGGKHRDAKALTGSGGAGAPEVVKDYRSDTFRAVYILRYGEAAHVPQALQKKSKTGRETPHRDREAAALSGVYQPDVSKMLRGVC